MDVKLFSDKFSAFDVEPQMFLQRRPSEQPRGSNLNSLYSVEHMHYNWLVRRALYKWRKHERDRCLQEKLRLTYRPGIERKFSGDVYRPQPWHNGKTDLSSSVEIVPIRRCEENKNKKHLSAQRKQILKVTALNQGVNYRIRRVRFIKKRKGEALVADLHNGNTILLPSSFTTLSEEEINFLGSGNVSITYNGRIGGMDVLEFE
ncbi:uncharacterized protein LOC126281765 [Schistocerca gregaria]|uniref:uncharacterized protein LOC126281765 n=1 Tax=Schistocerca gregaria TaxID=7010 RepID=UPI00211E314A|nr:uncharacterized protein LOC126281765 [Schistocerca gregaria]